VGRGAAADRERVTTLAVVEFHPEAIAEAAAARRWYAERSSAAAEGFQAELDHAVLSVAEAPSRWVRHIAGTRRFVLHRFPFSVVYFELQAGVLVLAVAHAKRRPGYWRVRMPTVPPGGEAM
jgi:plasmid stabilization system protein ParE